MQDLYSIVKTNVVGFGNRLFVQYKEDNVICNKTYSDLYEDANRMLSVFKEMHEKKIAIISENSYQWIVCFLAVIASKNILIPLDVRLNQRKTEELLSNSETSVILYSRDQKDKIENLSDNIIKYCIQDLFICDLPVSEPEGEVNLDDVCMIMYTSGSTGESKGVMISQRNLIANTKSVIEHAKMPETYNELSILPMFHIFALSLNIIWPLMYGNTVILSSGMASFVSELKEFNIYHTCLVPMLAEYLYHSLLQAERKFPSLSRIEIKDLLCGKNFKKVGLGGAYIKPDLRNGLSTFGLDVYAGYGMTECVIVSTEEGYEIKEGSAGVLVSCNEIKIIDNEICIKGPNVAKGYYKNAEATEKVFKDGWLHTGDIGYIDSENYLYIKGKKKNLIITSNGENVSPEELEKELLQSKGIKELIVYQKEDKIALEVYPDMSYFAEKNETEIKNYFSKVIHENNLKNPGYKHIKILSLRFNEFEKTSTMKIKRENFYYK